MRILGIDHGDRRFGLALSDPGKSFAFPFEVIEGEDALFKRLGPLLEEKEVERIIVGLPLNMDGSTGKKANQVLDFKERLFEKFSITIDVWDERLTTVQAENLLREVGGSARKRKSRVDMVAAQIILQSYLDAHTPVPGEEGSG